jgi:predicted nucleic acid-binding Zn ribbon protein
MERIEAEVRRELDRFGPEAGLGEVVAAWPAAVGPEIARNAWPARIGRDGTLHVAAGSSAWAYELTQLEEEMLQRLRATLGDEGPTRLRFAVGPLPEPGADPVEEVRRSVPEVTPRDRAEGERLAREIAASELRELVARAASASLAIARADRPL